MGISTTRDLVSKRIQNSLFMRPVVLCIQKFDTVFDNFQKCLFGLSKNQ